MANQVVDDCGIRQRRRISQAVQLIRGDFTQNATHDLARAGFWQAWRPLDNVDFGDRTDLVSDLLHQLVLQVVRTFLAGHQCDIGIDALAGEFVWVADDGCFGDLWVQDQSRFPRDRDGGRRC